jgi:hypothetical protein
VQGGNDINVYLYASGQFLRGEDIYTLNPFNPYLYSPLFALTLAPLSRLPLPVARVVWMLLNLLLAVRLWRLWRDLVPTLSPGHRRLWSIAVIVLAAGPLNHNLLLGQVTILILWLTTEGLVQVARGRPLPGAALIALGINFKIIPVLALMHLGMRGRLRALAYAIALVGVTLLIPAAVHGWDYNARLLRTWGAVINPAGKRFAFEDNDGGVSLSALLPAYFYDFGADNPSLKPRQRKVKLPRMIFAVSRPALTAILLAGRVLLLLTLMAAMLPRSWLAGPLRDLPTRLRRAVVSAGPERGEGGQALPVVFWWELAMLCLVTLPIFPHQMKYSMLYFLPAGAYVVGFYLGVAEGQVARRPTDWVVGGAAIALLAVLEFMGPGWIGSHLADILDYYHIMGLIVLLFVPILWYCHPQRLLGLPARTGWQSP